MVALTFAVQRPVGLHKLIIIGTPASRDLFQNDLLQITKQLSLSGQQAIQEAVQKEDFTNPAYLDALKEFTQMFFCRANPWPKEFEYRNKNQADDPTVREAMLGQSPWIIDGATSDFNIIPQLHLINVPTLILNGDFDTAQSGSVEPLQMHIPVARWETVSNASHMGHLDSLELQKEFLKLTGEFLA